MPYRIVAAQALTGTVFALALMAADAALGAAGAMATAVIVVPNGFFAARAVMGSDGTPEQQARRLLGQGVAKSIATVAFMVIVFARWTPAPWPFFGTLVVLQAMHWLVPLVSGPPRSRA